MPVDLRLLDDESKGENTTKLAEKLVQEGVALYFVPDEGCDLAAQS